VDAAVDVDGCDVDFDVDVDVQQAQVRKVAREKHFNISNFNI
jgi:hypothetical protein